MRRAPLYTKNAPAKCCRACTPYFTRVCAHFNQRPHDWPPQSARRFATGRKSRTKATLSRFCRSPGGSEPSAPSKKSTYAEGHVAHLGASASRLSRGCFQRQSMCPRPAPGFGQPRPIGRLVRAGPATDGHAFRHGVAKTVWAVLSSESGCSSAWVRGQRLRIGRLAPGPQPPTGRRAGGTAAPPECTCAAPPGTSLRGQGWRAAARSRRRRRFFGRAPAPVSGGCTAGCRGSWRTRRPPARCPSSRPAPRSSP